MGDDPSPADGAADDLTEAPDLADVYTATCPIHVRTRAMIHRWDKLTFLHWPYDPAAVQALLPRGLEVETFDGQAWVGLVPFLMQVRPARGPAIPWLSNFCETNVRTYVRAPDGTTGVWFLSLDAARFLAVATARTTYRLPYFWSKMRIDEVGDLVTYRSGRRFPGPRGARCDVAVRVGAAYAPDELTPFDHYLTARWRLYSARRGAGARLALAEHPPWPLHRATVVHLNDDLVRAAGLPAPTGEPIVHHSPGVEVQIGLPTVLRP